MFHSQISMCNHRCIITETSQHKPGTRFENLSIFLDHSLLNSDPLSFTSSLTSSSTLATINLCSQQVRTAIFDHFILFDFYIFWFYCCFVCNTESVELTGNDLIDELLDMNLPLTLRQCINTPHQTSLTAALEAAHALIVHGPGTRGEESGIDR
jgi:hypothetical protein